MIKIVTGFGDDQKYSIPDDEAHKAYYLFMNPEKRGIFSTGLALIGKHIQSVEPDYHGTMGWNSTHELDSDDWNEIKGRGVDRQLRDVLNKAKDIALRLEAHPEFLNQKLSEINLELSDSKNFQQLSSELADKFKIR